MIIHPVRSEPVDVSLGALLAFRLASVVALHVFMVLLACPQRARAEIDFDFDFVPERRESPTKREHGLMAFPIYTHLPGIGSAFGFGFLSSNILGSRTNALGALAGGDANLAAFGITEVHLLPKNLTFNTYAYSTRIPFQLYDRGPSSNQGGYVSLVRKEYGATAEANLHFWDRRFQFSAMVAPSRLLTTGAASPGGAKFTNSDNSEVGTLGTTARLQLDLTDDDLDARRGLKLQLVHHGSIVYDATHSRYGSLSAIATAYIPVLTASTWVLNVFRSSSSVWSSNTMSEAELRQQIGFNCGAIGDIDAREACLVAENRRVRERLNENKYGTAALLGGPTQMRGFPVGRFRGSEALFYATEFRWNITDENTAFDFGLIRGKRSLLQIAPFLEFGTVVDPPDTVEGTPLEASFGVGFRMGFSGALVRADIGYSSEGPQVTFFFGYPWDLPIL